MVKSLIARAIKNSGSEARYFCRMSQHPTLVQYGKLPQKFVDIVNEDSPWFCHGLAFRLATYSDESEVLFTRWEALLEAAQGADGWKNEYKHWSNTADHWAEKWDKFYQLLWLLQCYEYFSQRGYSVTFPENSNVAAPDLRIERPGSEPVFAECFFYTKWWAREHFIEDVLGLVDRNLSIRRTHNVAYNDVSNPFSDGLFTQTLGDLTASLAPEKLAKAVTAANNASPQIIRDLGSGVMLLLNGSGDYQPNPDNAHGDPKKSLSAFIREIVKAKKGNNNLLNSRPNILMTNALGVDFQLGLIEQVQASNHVEPDDEIDELWISACGVDEALEDCPRVIKLRRNGFPALAL